MPLVTGNDLTQRGLTCLGAVNYDPAVAVTKTTGAAAFAMTAFDTTNARITFTAPASGRVYVRLNVTAISGGSSFPTILLGVLDGSTVRFRASPLGGQLGVFAATVYAPQEVLGMVSGLTPSASYSFDAAYGCETSVGTTAIKYGGPNDTTGNNAWGALQFEVWAEETGGTDWTQPVDDTLSLADATSFGRGLVLADTAGLADLAATAAVYARAVPDTVTPSDAISFARDLHIDDTVSLSDSATPQSGKEALIADTLSLSDSVTTTTAYARSVSDSVTPSDSLSSTSAYVRQIDDTLSLPSDVCTPVKGVGGVDWAQPIADTLTLADSLATTSTYVLGVADSVTLDDTLASSAAYLRALADSLTLTDSLSAQLETISEGYPGPFDAGTETGRGSVSVDDDDFVTVPGGRTRARALSADFTSTQRGKIGAR